MENNYLTAREVAQKLKLTRQAVYQMASNGSLPCIRLGGGPKAAVRFGEREIEQWLSAKKKKTVEYIRRRNGDREAVDQA